MPKQTSYDLLKEVYTIVNRLEDKVDKRVGLTEGRLDKIEGKVDNLLGKIGIGVMVVSAVISSGIAFLFSFLKKD
jgi:hypothetical protein